MSLRISLGAWSAAFYASLGMGALAGCGGSTTDGTGNHDGLASEDAGENGGAAGRAGAGGSVIGNGGSGGILIGTGGSFAGAGGILIATGGSGGFSGGTGGRDGSVGQGLPCTNPQPFLGPNGEPSGFVQCDGGWMHRETQMTCPTWLPRSTTFPSYDGGSSCTSDADCTAQPNGFCGSPADYYIGVYQCLYGCRTDAECSPGSICVCGNPVGSCVQATCTTNADCGDGFLCARYQIDPSCGPYAFACQTSSDQCMSGSDCNAGSCVYENGVRRCSDTLCVIGRPFLVQGEERTATVVARADWAAAASPSLDGLDADATVRLAAHWAHVARLEHASIAAFARFTLELLSLGAPPDLVEATQQAMADETRHARLAFGLASAFGAGDVGPGPLDIEHALGPASLHHIVRTAVLEGCIGETVAAVEAAEALERATDPAVRTVLERIARDETRHAALAYRFVKWALSTAAPSVRSDLGAEIVALVEREIERARMAAEQSGGNADESDIATHGLLPESVSREIRVRVLSEIVRPCARALLDAPHAPAPFRDAVSEQ